MTGFEALLTGRVLVDRYRIEAVIGRGGMGAVYRAIDERLGRAVAVKVITAMGGADPEARERIRARFRHEAAAAARLPHHPNVVPVYDYGTDPALELDFIVMELLRGEDLATRLQRLGPPPPETGAEILYQAARGLAVGHRAGVIHRDVKPGNVFLVHPDDPEELQVRVLDFGIAKMVAEEDTFTQLTQDGRAPLSPAYASPEQLRAEARLTPASDVFSLGAVAFQLLTGERPFTDADRSRMGIGLPVPVPSLRTRAAAVSPALEAVVQRALAHDPAERYPHAGAFAEALDRARRNPDELPPPPTGAGGAAAGAAGAAAGAGAAGRPPAGGPTRMADDDRTLLAPEPRPAGHPEPAPPVRQAPPPPRRRPAERGGSSGFVWALVALLVVAGGLFAWLTVGGSRGDGSRPLSDLADTLAADSMAVDTMSPLYAARQNDEGEGMMENGQYAEALQRFRQALRVDPANAKYRFNLGYALLRMGEHAEAAEHFRRVARTEPDRHVAAFRHLATTELARGDTAGAMQALEEYIRRSQYEPGRQEAEALLQQILGLTAVPDPVVPDTTPAPPAVDTVPGAPRDTLQLGPPPARTARPAPRDTLRIPPEG